MSGHSQFKNIMYRKGAQDAKKAKVFAKLARDITIAAKSGMPEPDKNPRLRLAIAAARAESMPKDNIERAIAKATQTAGGDDYVSTRYEGFGPGKVAVIVECLTDNKNRTAGNVRTVFGKRGGAMGETGSVTFNFERIGFIEYPAAAAAADAMFEAALEAGANDVVSDEEHHDIETLPDDLNMVTENLEAKFGTPAASRLEWKPLVKTDITDVETAKKFLDFVDAMEEDDDVQHVYHNAEIAEDVMQKLAAE
ncbi:MAG: YebC/PmpR family DNA-binding transcriptional regulator [Alphaproteobacteria bacterium]|nr:YebC/PmpR family DNA-binding transcriptional regulator [Alphaproteobacteria bacterium]MBQ9235671.1 YebC/PmpR family DNA-binding transcriptional regulator [Alphaproteobacteria bacterium]